MIAGVVLLYILVLFNTKYFLSLIITMTEELELLTKRALAGDVTAQFALGELYLEGVRVSKDDVAAAHWFSLAAEAGHPAAQQRRRGTWPLARRYTSRGSMLRG